MEINEFSNQYENENSIFSFGLLSNPEDFPIKSNINEIISPNPYEQLINSDIISKAQIIPEIPKKELFIEISKNETQEKSNKEKQKNKKLLGKKIKNSSLKNSKKHDKYSSDNILRKIFVFSMNFILNIFMNEVVEKCHLKKKKNEDKFIEIEGPYKKAIGNKNFDEYKNKTIYELLNYKNNGRWKNKNKNKDLLDYILANNNNPIFNKIISKKYIDIFKEVYYKNKKDIIYEGLSLNLQITFDDFLNKNNAIEESSYMKRIYEILEKLYFPKKFNVIKKNNLGVKISHRNDENFYGL